jgi:hypothetical protein
MAIDSEVKEWEARFKRFQPAQSKRERQWRNAVAQRCKCGALAKENTGMCTKCTNEVNELEALEVKLDQCSCVAELKAFIKEHLL